MKTNSSLCVYFDFLSPYSYFLYKTFMSKSDQLNHVTVEWKPIVLAKLFQHWETKAPAEIQPKREFLFRQGLRYAKKNNILFMPPSNHPFNPLYALRLACLATSEGNTQIQLKIIDLLWEKIWGQGLSPDQPETLIEWLNQKNLNGNELVEKTYNLAVKNELKLNTQQACQEGSFGAPTIIAVNPLGHKELFWGNDSFEDMMHFLNNNDYLDRNIYDKIIAIQYAKNIANNEKASTT